MFITVFNAFFKTYLILCLWPFDTSFNTCFSLYLMRSLMHIKYCIYQSGAWALESLLQGLRFLSIFEKSGKSEATNLAVSQLRGSTIAIISGLVPGPHTWASAARARVQVLQNSGSRKVMLRFTTLSARDRYWRNPRKKKLQRAQQYKKRACQCTDGLSATQNDQGAAERFRAHQESSPSRPTPCGSAAYLNQ